MGGVQVDVFVEVSDDDADFVPSTPTIPTIIHTAAVATTNSNNKKLLRLSIDNNFIGATTTTCTVERTPSKFQVGHEGVI